MTAVVTQYCVSSAQQKMSIGGLLVFFEPSVAQIVMGLVFAMSWALLFSAVRQFTSQLLNLINDSCSVSIMLALIGALSLRATENAPDLMGVSKSVVSGLLIFSTAFPVAILLVVFIITVGEHVLEKRQRRNAALKQAPAKKPEPSEVEHVATQQQQPPANLEDALQSSDEPQERPELQPPVTTVVLQRPAWFEGEQDGRRFYFHEPSGTSQWNPPDEPYVPFTPTTAAAPSIFPSFATTAPQLPDGESNVAISHQTTLREQPPQPDDARNL